MAGTPNPRVEIHSLHPPGLPPPGRKARQRSKFAPPRPDYPAAS
jgi:hypothetical protein